MRLGFLGKQMCGHSIKAGLDARCVCAGVTTLYKEQRGALNPRAGVWVVYQPLFQGSHFSSRPVLNLLPPWAR